MTSNRLQNKAALITGASSGLGRAIALAYAAEGARVACVDLFPNPRDATLNQATGKALHFDQRAAGMQTHDLLRERHPRSEAIYVQADFTKAADVEAAVARVVDHFGRLDVLVNNAGISVESSHERVMRCHETTEADWDKTLAINTKGVFLGCKYAIAQMLKQQPLAAPDGHAAPDRGFIVNTASIQGLVAYYGTRLFAPAASHAAAYCASKGAVVQLTKQIALDYAKDRIHCNALCPGFLNTPMTLNHQDAGPAQAAVDAAHPLGGMGCAEDVARVAVFLASNDARWVTGHPMVVDGGYTIV